MNQTVLNLIQNSSTTTVFPTISPSVMEHLSIFQVVLMIIIATIGFIGNTLVLLVITKRKHRCKTSSVLILNLAVCDTLVSVVCIPLDLTWLISRRWVFGDALCNVIYPFQTSLPIVSSYTLMFMLFERNMIFSNRIRSNLRATTVKILAGITWALPFAMVAPYAFKLGIKGTGNSVSCEENWSNGFYRQMYTVALSVVEYLIPIVLIITFVVKIIRCLRRERNLVKRGMLGLGRRTSKRRIRTQRRLAIIFIVMVLTYASLKLPNNVFWQWLEFGGGSKQPHASVVHIFVGLCAYSTCATNPFILILMSSEFRKDIRAFFLDCKKKRRRKGHNNNILNSDSEKTAMVSMLQTSNSFSTRTRLASRRINRTPRGSTSSEESKRPVEMAKKLSVAFKDQQYIDLPAINCQQGNSPSKSPLNCRKSLAHSEECLAVEMHDFNLDKVEEPCQ
ncbi:galanin receptor type 1-like [Rhopilema esculentum]|uniref:galanin receptor type 1-like n=1 Tax=Rhopilema esculentum TaxID=499914 RepID=UPI0031E4594C|eukprot:gene5286-440_t